MRAEIPHHPFKYHHHENRKSDSLSAILLVLLSFLITTKPASSFMRFVMYPPKFIAKVSALREQHRCHNTLSTTTENDALYTELCEEIESIAGALWGDAVIPRLASTASANEINPEREQGVSLLFEGEAGLPKTVPFSERGDYFRTEALRGCPKAQHSYGLLLWSGFAGIEQNPEESAKFHAAAACQHHLDGMAVFGGCLRTGTGIPKKKQKKNKKPSSKTNTVALGLKAIDFCASVGNPTGVNKQAALLESNGNDSKAVDLYEASWRSGRVNALLLFNLGWCLVNDRGVVDKHDNKDRGIVLWKDATELAPDEGSEEAAWNLYQEYSRDDPKEAQRWLDIAEELGYCE